MKITIYELLGLIKEGKAPKKIRYKDKVYFRSWTGYMGDEPIDEYYYDSNENSWNSELCLRLDDLVEIIEEEKEIEKIPYHYNFGYIDCGDLKREVIEELSNNFNYFADKINKLIDEVKKLKESK